MAELTLFWSCSYCFCFQGYAEVTLAKMMDENQLGAIFILRKGKGVGGIAKYLLFLTGSG